MRKILPQNITENMYALFSALFSASKIDMAPSDHFGGSDLWHGLRSSILETRQRDLGGVLARAAPRTFAINTGGCGRSLESHFWVHLQAQKWDFRDRPHLPIFFATIREFTHERTLRHVTESQKLSSGVHVNGHHTWKYWYQAFNAISGQLLSERPEKYRPN